MLFSFGTRRIRFFLFAVLSVTFLFLPMVNGCGNSSGKDNAATGPAATTSLTGVISLPSNVNTALLTSTRFAQNTDSAVRTAFASATVIVNGSAIADRTILTSAISTDWEFRLRSVPEAANGLYRIEVSVGKLGLKSWVRAARKDAFRMDARTTGAALLADAASRDADDLLATFSALITSIAGEIENGFNTSTSFTGSIFSLASLTAEIARQKTFLQSNPSFDPRAKVAYLGLSNDIDADGKADLFVRTSIDGTRIGFESSLSSYTSMMEDVASLSDYMDVQLVDDFSKNNTVATRTFGVGSTNIALGLFFKRAAGHDTYLKLLLKRVDIFDGSFKGAVAEYAFATASGTAVSSGTKIFARMGSQPDAGTVGASDFLHDSTATDALLVYLDPDRGLGCFDGQTPMVRSIVGQPELKNVGVAEPYDIGTYFVNSAKALQKIMKNRAPRAGDVFSAYFPATRHYAIFKVKEVTDMRLTVDYIVNSAPDDWAFDSGAN
ncbi:MAG: hypothetical protein WA705_30740 [Candidatus Ozemobacteraceae bacterium]